MNTHTRAAGEWSADTGIRPVPSGPAESAALNEEEPGERSDQERANNGGGDGHGGGRDVRVGARVQSLDIAQAVRGV